MLTYMAMLCDWTLYYLFPIQVVIFAQRLKQNLIPKKIFFPVFKINFWILLMPALAYPFFLFVLVTWKSSKSPWTCEILYLQFVTTQYVLLCTWWFFPRHCWGGWNRFTIHHIIVCILAVHECSGRGQWHSVYLVPRHLYLLLVCWCGHCSRVGVWGCACVCK